MKNVFEMGFYVAVSAGMAMGTSSFLVIAGAFEALPAAYVMIAIFVAMVFCMLISSPIAEMASMFPSSPGVRTYVRQAYGDVVSLFVVFLYLIFLIVAAGAESYMFAYVVRSVVPSMSMWVPALTLIVGVAVVNWIGVTPSRGTQIATTAVLSLGVFALGVAALIVGGTPSQAATTTLGSGLLGLGGSETVGALSNFAVLPSVVGICVFLFIGFEWVTPLGFGPSAYARRIPLAMPIGICLNAVLYLVFVWGAASVLSDAQIAGTPAPQLPLATALMGGSGPYAMVVLCVLATASTFNAGVMGGARLIYALAREQRLPAWCARFSEESGVPRGAIVLLALLCSTSTALIIALDVQLAAAFLASALICSVYAALLFSARRLRRTQPMRSRSFRSRLDGLAMALLALSILGLGISSIAAEPRLAVPIALCAVVCCAAAALLAWWSLFVVQRDKARVTSKVKAN